MIFDWYTKKMVLRTLLSNSLVFLVIFAFFLVWILDSDDNYEHYNCLCGCIILLLSSRLSQSFKQFEVNLNKLEDLKKKYLDFVIKIQWHVETIWASCHILYFIIWPNVRSICRTDFHVIVKTERLSFRVNLAG